MRRPPRRPSSWSSRSSAIWLTYLGFGSIALWAFRFAWVQFGALGTLMSRALPLLMITLLVYFSGELLATRRPE